MSTDHTYKIIELVGGHIQPRIFPTGRPIHGCVLVTRIHIPGNRVVRIWQGVELSLCLSVLEIVDRPIAGQVTPHEQQINIIDRPKLTIGGLTVLVLPRVKPE